MKNHRIPLPTVCKRLSRERGERLLRAIAERNQIVLGIDWDAITKWPSPEFDAAYKRLDPMRQGAFNAVLVVIEDIGKAEECSCYADLVFAAMGKCPPPGLSFYDKIAWAYEELTPLQWEHLRTIAKAAAVLRTNWSWCRLLEETPPDLSPENDRRLLSQAELALRDKESRGEQGQIATYELAQGRRITILTLADRVVARRLFREDGTCETALVREAFELVFYWDPRTCSLRVWANSEEPAGRERLLKLWAGIYARTTTFAERPKNTYNLELFRGRENSELETYMGISGMVTKVTYGSDAGDRSSSENYNLGVYDGACGDWVRAAPGVIESAEVKVRGGAIGEWDIVFREHQMLGCDGEGEKQEAIRGYFRQLGVCA